MDGKPQPVAHIWQETSPMFDYRLFFAGSTLDTPPPARHPATGHDAKRVFRLAAERRAERARARR